MTISRQLLFALIAPAILAGCTTTQRLTAVPAASALEADTGFGPVRFLVGRETDSFAAEAHASLVKERAWRAANGFPPDLPPAHFLAISGGGDNGAFGAGFLNGWSATGTRPEFKIVTGVSTGALTAPFAFLGSRYDASLTRVFTTVAQANIFKSRGMVKGVLSDAMADSKPLANLIAANVDQPLLDAIAAEYAKGRVLLVGTTNLDSLEPVIWNMTAIAASRQPGALQLFRSVLLASASIPGAFPPVMINVNVGGVPHQEMHVDGGTMSQVFVYPPSLTEAKIGETTHRQRHLYVIRNARFDSEWKDVPRKTMPIAARAIGSLTTTQGIGDLYRIYATSQRDGVDFNFVNIPSSFSKRHREEFDTEYMRELYALGKQMAEAGHQWHKFPPGFERAGRE